MPNCTTPNADIRKETVNFLKQNPDKKCTAREIAEHLFKNEKDLVKKIRNHPYKADLSGDKELEGHIVCTIGNFSKTMSKDGIKIIESSYKKKYYYTKSTDAQEVENAENAQSPNTDKIREHDLYPLLADFLLFGLSVYSKRINETRSANLQGPNGNKWLYPDLVGFEYMSKDWNDEIKHCVKVSGDKRAKLWSFEVKLLVNRSNVREAFFQTVSNSSWANFGYLVASELDNNALNELKILSGLHGIGFILLDTKSPTESKILIHAREKVDIDWNTANRIASTNPDFKNYIKTVREFYQSGNEGKHFWDKTED